MRGTASSVAKGKAPASELALGASGSGSGRKSSIGAHASAVREASRGTPIKARPSASAGGSGSRSGGKGNGSVGDGAGTRAGGSVIDRLTKPTVASANQARSSPTGTAGSPRKQVAAAGSNGMSTRTSPTKPSAAAAAAAAANGKAGSRATGRGQSPRALKLTPGKSTIKAGASRPSGEKQRNGSEKMAGAQLQQPAIEEKKEGGQSETKPEDEADIPEIPSDDDDDDDEKYGGNAIAEVQQGIADVKLDDSKLESESELSRSEREKGQAAANSDGSSPLSPAAAAAGLRTTTTEKVFTGFGPDRPHGKIGLPTTSLGEGAPDPMRLSPLPSPATASAAAAAGNGQDFTSKWGTRDGPSPTGGSSSRAVSPSGSSQGTATAAIAGEKKVPIWMRKGGADTTADTAAST